MAEPAARRLLADGASRLVAWQRRTSSSSSSSTSTTPTAVVVFSSVSPPPSDEELAALERLFGDRESAIRSGMVLEGKRFEVHRHHPPLIYGREMGCDPAHAEGAAVCAFEGAGGAARGAAVATATTATTATTTTITKENGVASLAPPPARCYAAITYNLPHVSARMVPLLQGFCDEVFGGVRREGEKEKEKEEGVGVSGSAASAAAASAAAATAAPA